MNLAFHLAVTPGQDDGGVDCLFVATQTIAETPDFRQTCSSRSINPGLQAFTLLAAENSTEALCQVVENGDLRAALVQLGKLLLLGGLQLFWSPGQQHRGLSGRRRFGLSLPRPCRRSEIRGSRNTKGGNEFSHCASASGIALVLDLVPEFGRVMAAVPPSTKEKLAEFIDAWRSPVRCRPFRVLAGTQEAPDGLSLNM
jgi:hypothetical protein